MPAHLPPDCAAIDPPRLGGESPSWHRTPPARATAAERSASQTEPAHQSPPHEPRQTDHFRPFDIARATRLEFATCRPLPWQTSPSSHRHFAAECPAGTSLPRARHGADASPESTATTGQHAVRKRHHRPTPCQGPASAELSLRLWLGRPGSYRDARGPAKIHPAKPSVPAPHHPTARTARQRLGDPHVPRSQFRPVSRRAATPPPNRGQFATSRNPENDRRVDRGPASRFHRRVDL